MIPVNLKMHNFMCYRDAPPLSFEGIHTACICGNNGNGKSALVDAITWALWGQARGKSDDDLIHATQSEMEVEFDFAVGQQLYRVIRKHSRPRKRQASGQTSLDLLIGDSGSFKVISADRIKDTERKIRGVLRMDYDTFVNSAFLRQGHADEFTRQAPAKRKEVLANILGLSVYDELEERAKELVRERAEQKAQLENSLKEISQELVHKPEYEAQMTQVLGELADTEKAVAEQSAKLERLHQERASLENKASQLVQLDGHIGQTESALHRWEEQIRQHGSRAAEYQALINQRAAIEAGYGELVRIKKLNSELDQKFRQVAGLNDYRHRLEKAIEKAQAELLAGHRVTQSRIEELDARARLIPRLKEEAQELENVMRRLTAEEETLSEKKKRYQELQAAVSVLESNQARLVCDMEEVEGKLGMLLSQGEAVCPLCESQLGEEGLALIEKKYAAERDSRTAALKSLRAEHAGNKAELQALESDISAREIKLGQEKSRLQRSAGIANQRMVEAEQASLRLTAEMETLRGIEERLARKDFAAAEQKALAEVEAELATTAYQPEEHRQVSERLAELEPYEDSKRRLDEAGRLLAQETQLISRAEQASQELKLSLETDRRTRQALSLELESLPQVSSNLARLETEYQATVLRQKQVAETLGSIRGRLERCAELEEKERLKEDQLSQTVKEEQVYRELAEAYGRGGIQAMLIEVALPEVEIEANKLLGRMTDNRMHLKIETQRETKKGNVAETLDINISDEMGLRSYEMFSGGEAFRIDFAIRIALSRLLARRAGAPLPTLIIDEGFGTQDSTGLEKIKEAINSIQDDFEKILVITHIEELKDAFPTRIDVVKTADGSTLEVS